MRHTNIRLVASLISVMALLVVAAIPATAEAQTPETSEDTTTYTVQRGDTLSILAQRYDTTVVTLAEMNDIQDVNLIVVGQELQLPAPESGDTDDGDGQPTEGSDAPFPEHVVRPGDTLAQIAAQYGSTVAEVAQANRIADVDLIYVGQVLVIPVNDGTPPPPTNGDAPPDRDGEGDAATQICEGPRYTVDYPADWYANTGAVTDACGWFSREPIQVEPATELITEIVIYIDPVAYEDALATVGIEAQGEELTIDGREAVRVESTATNPALIPEGTPITRYFVNVGAGETLIANTYGLPEYDYEANQQVLDDMMQTLDFTDE